MHFIISQCDSSFNLTVSPRSSNCFWRYIFAFQLAFARQRAKDSKDTQFTVINQERSSKSWEVGWAFLLKKSFFCLNNHVSTSFCVNHLLVSHSYTFSFFEAALTEVCTMNPSAHSCFLHIQQTRSNISIHLEFCFTLLWSLTMLTSFSICLWIGAGLIGIMGFSEVYSWKRLPAGAGNKVDGGRVVD